MTTLAAYGFDEGSGVVAADAVGARDIVMSDPGNWDAAGHTGAAFDGTGGVRTVPSHAGLETASRTLMFWARSTTGVPGTRWLTQFYLIAPDTAAWGIGWIGGNLLFRARIGGVNNAVSTPIVDAENWHHFAVTYDGATLRGYRDAVEMGSLGVAGVINTADEVRITDQTNGDLIDDLRFFDAALTQPEIAALMDEPVAGEVLGDVVMDLDADVVPVGVVGKVSGTQIAPSVTILATAAVGVSGQAQITATTALTAAGAIDGSGGTAITQEVAVVAAGVVTPAFTNPGGLTYTIELLSDILDLLTSDESEGGCPLPCFCRVAVYAGLEVPWDSCTTGGACGECDGQLYAAVQSVVPVQGDGAGACRAFNFTAIVGAVRCAAKLKDDDLNPFPSVEAVQNDAIRQARDADGIFYALTCCPTRPQRLKDAGIVLESWAPLGPQDCVGGAWTITGRFDVCC